LEGVILKAFRVGGKFPMGFDAASLNLGAAGEDEQAAREHVSPIHERASG
jgi:hypothetical protein